MLARERPRSKIRVRLTSYQPSPETFPGARSNPDPSLARGSASQVSDSVASIAVLLRLLLIKSMPGVNRYVASTVDRQRVLRFVARSVCKGHLPGIRWLSPKLLPRNQQAPGHGAMTLSSCPCSAACSASLRVRFHRAASRLPRPRRAALRPPPQSSRTPVPLSLSVPGTAPQARLSTCTACPGPCNPHSLPAVSSTEPFAHRRGDGPPAPTRDSRLPRGQPRNSLRSWQDCRPKGSSGRNLRRGSCGRVIKLRTHGCLS